MTRRQLLAALTGCAVAMPTRPVVMIPKRYGMTQGRRFDLLVIDDVAGLHGESCHMDQKTWDAWTSKIIRYDLRHP